MRDFAKPICNKPDETKPFCKFNLLIGISTGTAEIEGFKWLAIQISTTVIDHRFRQKPHYNLLF